METIFDYTLSDAELELLGISAEMTPKEYIDSLEQRSVANEPYTTSAEYEALCDLQDLFQSRDDKKNLDRISEELNSDKFKTIRESFFNE